MVQQMSLGTTVVSPSSPYRGESMVQQMSPPLSSDTSPVATEGSPSSPHRGEPMLQHMSPSAAVVSPSSPHRVESLLQKIIPDAISSVHSANPVSTLQASLQLTGLTAGKIGSLA